MGGPSDPLTNEISRWLLWSILSVFGAGDLLLFALWVVGRSSSHPLLARYWSFADLFLGLQAVVGLVILAAFVQFVVLGLGAGLGLYRLTAVQSADDLPAPILFWVVLAPVLLAQQAALVGVPLGVVWLKYHERAAELGLAARGRSVWKQAAAGALVALALLPLNDFVETVCRYLLLNPHYVPIAPALRKLSEQANALGLLKDVLSEPAALILCAAIIGLIGPVAEEIFFRGFAYRVMKERLGVPAAIGLSAALFPAIHGNPVDLVPIFLMGLVLAWLFERTGSLAMSIGMHCANNLAALALYLWAPHFNLWDRFMPGG